MDDKKYEFTGETKTAWNGVVIRQIRRLKDGAIGGWIEADKNLDQFGDAWVFGDAQVFGDAWVFGNARVNKPLDFIHITGTLFPITILNDGFASIGCQTRRISEWLSLKFEDQSEIESEEEFDRNVLALHPIFKLYREPAIKTTERKEEVAAK